HQPDSTLTVATATASITVTPYSVIYDSAAHISAGSAPGLFLHALPTRRSSDLTTHTAAGTYNGDGWSFHDAAGNYNDASGTVNDAIAQTDLFLTATANANRYRQTASDTGTVSGVQGSDGITYSFASAGDGAHVA